MFESPGWALAAAVCFLCANAAGAQPWLPPPPPPPKLPDLTPTLTGTLQQAAIATVQGNEVIASIMAARGSDPTQWTIAAKAVESISIRPVPTPGEKLDQLKLKLHRLEDQMLADGYRFNADAIVCVVAPEGCVLDEDRAYEIQDLGIAIANTRREILAVEQSPENASRYYIAAMKALHVPLPKQPQDEVIRARQSEPAIRPPTPPVQAKTLKDCSPVWESRTSWILTPKMVGFNGAGAAQFVYQYQPVKNPVATYPAGCN